MNDKKTFTVYRYIFGRDRIRHSPEGVPDTQLAVEGIFTRNYHEETEPLRRRPDRESRYEQHPILPVFVSKERVMRAFQPTNPPTEFKRDLPVLATADISYDLLFGPNSKLQLVKNMPHGLYEEPEYIVTEELADRLKSGETPPGHGTGEFYLEPVNGVQREEFIAIVREHERFFRPLGLDDRGCVILEKGFREIHPKVEPDESTAEISKL